MASASSGEVNNYISEIQSNQCSFIAGYAPQELSKLDGAEVRRFGNYTAYAIASAEQKEIIFKELEKELKARK